MTDHALGTFDIEAVARRVLAENGFEATSAPAHDEAARLTLDTPTNDVRDLTALPWSSIDNTESRDLDQIEAIAPGDGGTTRVFVGIADVDALVPRHGEIERHAARNTTSVYTGALVFSMLPERLSTNLTSLVEGHPRRAVVTEFLVDEDGQVSGGERVSLALVKNHAKLAYDDVARWLEGAPAQHLSSEIQAQLHAQDGVAQRLRARRRAHGAIVLQSREPTAVTHDGTIVDIKVTEESRSRQLIEEFMIAANGVVARWLATHGRAAIRRIVRTPKRWDRIVALAAELGTELPPEPDPLALSQFLNARRAADPDRFADLSLSVVKLMGPGEYVLARGPDEAGHFGLAVHDYTHATAPNRRFVDLVTQRIVKAAIQGAAPPYADDELARTGAHCTEREHAAQKVERTMRKVGAALFLRSRIGEVFDGIVTGVTASGTFVRLFTPPAEGRVVRGERGLDVGDRVRVELVATEPARGFIDFARSA